MSRYTVLFIQVLGGLGVFLGFANPFLHFAFLVLLYPFALYVLSQISKNIVRDSLIMGILGYGASFYWIAVTMNLYGAVPYFLGVFAPLALGLYFALYGTVVAYYASKIQHKNKMYTICSLGLLWYILEYVRGFFLTGFSWFTLSSAFADMPSMIQIASITGSYVLSGIFALVGFCFAEWYVQHILKITPISVPNSWSSSVHFSQQYIHGFAVGILVLLYWYGSVNITKFHKENGEYQLIQQETLHKELTIPYKVAHEIPAILGQSIHSYYATDKNSENSVIFTIIQGNISQNIKWSPLFQEDSVKKFLRLSNEASTVLPPNTAPIFIYPETAFPLTKFHNPALYSEIVDFSHDKTMLFGIPFFEDNAYYNSIEAYQNSHFVGRYQKEHLVPFGEYVPKLPLPQFFNDFIAQYGGAYSIGNNEKNSIALGVKGEAQQKQNLFIGSLICYEAIFPEIATKSVQDGATILLNISNDAWYDKTSAPIQHLHISLMRAVENNVYMVRASNTGISAVINPKGEIVAQTGLFRDESLSVAIPIIPHNKTIFTRYSAYYSYFAVDLFLLLHVVVRRKNNLQDN